MTQGSTAPEICSQEDTLDINAIPYREGAGCNRAKGEKSCRSHLSKAINSDGKLDKACIALGRLH